MGWPVMHSRSPKLHNHWLAQYGLTGTYLPLAVPATACARRCGRLPALGFSGCNLTIPHRSRRSTSWTRSIRSPGASGAMNCVVVRARRIARGLQLRCLRLCREHSRARARLARPTADRSS